MSSKPNQAVRSLRKSLGAKFTQKQFAERVGTHPTYVSQVETGSQTLGSEIALRIADSFPAEMARLGLTVEDLLRGTRTPLSDGSGAAA